MEGMRVLMHGALTTAGVPAKARRAHHPWHAGSHPQLVQQPLRRLGGQHLQGEQHGQGWLVVSGAC